MGFWERLFSGDGFMPRRQCGVWDDGLIGLHVVSDAVIWLSYLWIPLVMVWTWRSQRGRFRLPPAAVYMLVLYVLFITACGWTHFFDALMFWDPVYRINGLVRAATAVISFATAVSLVRLMPLAVNAPVTIVQQQVAIRQQFAWLRDILDSATEGRLRLCASRDDLPPPAATSPVAAAVEVRNHADLAAVRTAVRTAAEEASFDSARIGDLLTSAHESGMNGLVHAGAADVNVYRSGGRVQVWVEDTGKGIPLDRLPIATLKQGFSTAGTAGQGWFFILTLVDAAYLLTGANGTTVVLEMDREPPQETLPFSSSVGGDVHAHAHARSS